MGKHFDFLEEPTEEGQKDPYSSLFLVLSSNPSRIALKGILEGTQTEAELYPKP